jgi:3-isopropylmalate/(R)-2-methylmalate dehydratase large subunit
MVDAAVPRTLFDKIWDRHQILEVEGNVLLHVATHLVHDGSRPAFQALHDRGLSVRRPDRTFGTPDHYVPTVGRDLAAIAELGRKEMVLALQRNATKEGITVFGLADERQGIIHVVGPEQGISLPGTVIVCGDSHTASHGALGALAFGIGSSEVAHVLATQTIWQRRPKTMRVNVEGALGEGVTAKDLILAIIRQIGVSGGVGHVIEYAGSAIRRASIESRLTICNMSIEAGARAGMIAPDDTTFQYLSGRPYAPSGEAWDRAMVYWRSLPTDPGASFDREVTIDAGSVEPMVTWGTNPGMSVPISGCVPDPAAQSSAAVRGAMEGALSYMGLVPGTRMSSVPVDRVFIGSCTNARIEDLREAARVAEGHTAKVPALVVPGSGLVKAQAEREGLDRIFREAGFEWRDAGCSMCVGINGDIGAPGERCASTSNRNFVGRQGKGVRTHLLSPAMAAAAAIAGRFADVREVATRHKPG